MLGPTLDILEFNFSESAYLKLCLHVTLKNEQKYRLIFLLALSLTIFGSSYMNLTINTLCDHNRWKSYSSQFEISSSQFALFHHTMLLGSFDCTCMQRLNHARCKETSLTTFSVIMSFQLTDQIHNNTVRFSFMFTDSVLHEIGSNSDFLPVSILTATT